MTLVAYGGAMRKDRRDLSDLRETILLVIGGGIFVVWSIAELASVFFNRPFDPALNGLLGLIVTGFLGGGYLAGRKKNGNGKPPPDEP